ncbi:hypothetical protein ACT691_02775 [Vibrio metschnikovii]
MNVIDFASRFCLCYHPVALGLQLLPVESVVALYAGILIGVLFTASLNYSVTGGFYTSGQVFSVFIADGGINI